MTIKEALDRIDALKPNTYEEGEKLRWISTLDARIHRDVVLTHEHNAAAESFAGYTAQTNKNTELLVAAPHDELYLYYLESKIDYYNGEMGKYNNSAAMFNSAYTEYANYINRTRKPLCKAKIRFF